ncbi:hypothetical protein [Nesterenkonia alba]|uniref:hypothetical protein n=1 Tax=Nesterenkonia alba TaxID=515814 RepID=UPI0003B6507B|nr:hypothetical protein [Nesterenkonia alba]
MHAEAQAPEILAQFAAEHIAPHRGDFRRAERLPSQLRLLGEALAACQIRVQKVTEGRWVFLFSGTVIGGWANGVTTLASAHSRRILNKPGALEPHLELMGVPYRPDPEPSPAPAGIPLQAYVVGQRAVSVLAMVPRESLDDAHDDDPATIAVDLTSTVGEDIADLAVKALRAVPGLYAGAVDLRVQSLENVVGAYVTGIDEAACILPHHFPTLGPGRPVAGALVEEILFTAAL